MREKDHLQKDSPCFSISIDHEPPVTGSGLPGTPANSA